MAAKWIVPAAALLALSPLCPPRAQAQATYTATGPGTYVTLGATFSGYQSDYGKRLLAGPTLFADGHLYRRVGFEVEFRDLAYHTDEGIRQRTYLAGPKLVVRRRNLRPYVKLLAGRGDFLYPFGYANGSYFVAAPGAGVDWRIGESRVSVRLVDLEYQIWPQFTFGALHPYGVSSGVSFVVCRGLGGYSKRLHN